MNSHWASFLWAGHSAAWEAPLKTSSSVIWCNSKGATLQCAIYPLIWATEKYVLQNQRNTLKKYPRNTYIVKSETTGGDSAVLCWAIYLLEWSARLKNASQIDFYGCNNSHRKLCSAASHQIQYNRKNLNEIQIQIQTQIWMQIKHKYTLTFMPAIVNFSMTCKQ